MSDHYEDAFATLFLPIEVPSCPLSESSKSKDENQSVLQCWDDFLRHEDTKVSFPQLHLVARQIVDLHQWNNNSQSPGNPSDIQLNPSIHASLSATHIEGFWGLWIREQNASLLVQRLNESTALILVWEVSCPNETVTGTPHMVVQALPRVGMRVSWPRLIDSTELLADLACNPQQRAQPMSHKAGQDNHEIRDVNSPLYALELLPCCLGGDALCPRETELRLLDESGVSFRIITKKMRDEVRYSSSKYPWRRAPVWSFMKGIFHLIDPGLYKFFVQRFLAFVLERLVSTVMSDSTPKITPSQLKEASMKLVRRLKKLECDDKHDILFKVTQKAVEKAMAYVKRAVGGGNVVHPSVECKIDPQDFLRDCRHSMPGSKKLLKQLVHVSDNLSGDVAAQDSMSASSLPDIFPRLRLWSALKSDDVKHQSELLRKCHEKDNFVLSPHDFFGTLDDIWNGVTSVFQGSNTPMLQPKCLQIENPDELVVALGELMDTLIKTGLIEDTLTNDVRSRSFVILLAFTVCLLIDQVSCEAHPLLKEHQLGLGEVAWLNMLFLTTAKQKQHLHHVEVYVSNRERASGAPLLEGSTSENSFSVRFAKSSKEMRNAWKSIQSRCVENQIEKRSERDRKFLRHEELTDYVSCNSCSCRWHNNDYQRWHETCTRCSKKSEARGIEVCYYDKLLPDSEYMQMAVVFDLQIPECISCHRDSFVRFAELVCNETCWTQEKWIGLWGSENRLQNWRKNAASKTVELGSTRKRLTQSHYKSAHVTKSKSNDFIVRHDYHTIPMNAVGCLIDIRDWRWKISHQMAVHVEDNRHSSLERFFPSFTHNENEVIALKCEASEAITLREFETVGSLRAGPKLQLVRLVNALVARTLSLDQADIVTLVTCVLWQVGPAHSSTMHWTRQSFSLLERKPEFVIDTCAILKEMADGCRDNWGNENILLNLTYIARALFEHSIVLGHTRGSRASSDFLLVCRHVAYEWIGRILDVANGCEDDCKMQKLRAKIVNVSVIGTFSFSDNSMLLDGFRDIAMWIYFRARFHDNFSPHHAVEQSLQRNHHFHALAVSTMLSPYVVDLLEHSVTRSKALGEFLRMYWSSSGEGRTGPEWKEQKLPGCQGCYYSRFFQEGRSCSLYVDVISGKFLVNGSPCACLPRNVTAHKLYRRLFGCSMFDVQPLGSGGYRTSRPILGHYFEFYPPDFNCSIDLGGAPMIIKVDAAESSLRSILIPHDVISRDVPSLLASGFSHWFVLTSKMRTKVQFLPVSYTDPMFRSTTVADTYSFDCRNWSLTERRTGNKMMDIHSPSFLKLHDSCFFRLTSPEYMHVFVAVTEGESEEQQCKVLLPRLQNIGFDFDGVRLLSREFTGFEVAHNQSIGTLVGLDRGLLLRGPSLAENDLFICPHGNVRRNQSSTSIDITNVCSPSYFKYEVRPELRDLQAKSKTSLEWYYLALLHAMTSSTEPDPFTHCTGSERAMELLRSGHCSGNFVSSLDTGVVKSTLNSLVEILGDLALISPASENYHGMEIKTLGHPFAHCSVPGLAFLAKLRLQDVRESAEQIGDSFLQLIETSLTSVHELLSDRISAPSTRTYFFRREYYTDRARLTREEEKLVFGFTKRSEEAFDPTQSFGKSAVKASKALGQSAQAQSISTIGSDLLELHLRGCAMGIKLSGFTGNCFRTLNKAVPEDEGIDDHFAHLWINLYKMAQEEVLKNNSGDVRLSSLLTWVCMEYPWAQPHLHRLLLVARAQRLFPKAPKFKSYRCTEQRSFISELCDEEVSKHLTKFNEHEPQLQSQADSRACNNFKVNHKAWKGRRDAHNASASATRATLRRRLASLFENGGSADDTTVALHNIDNPSRLKDAIQTLFRRWRKNAALWQFLCKVSSISDGLSCGSTCSLFPPISFGAQLDAEIEHVQVCSTGIATVEFCLAMKRTAPLRVRLESEQAKVIRQMARSGTFTESFSMKVEEKSSGENHTVNFESASFLKRNPEYTILYNRLTSQLENSWALAASETATTREFSEDDIRRLKSELDSYQKSAADTKDELWRIIDEQLGDETGIQALVGLWCAPTPATVVSEYFLESIESPPRCGRIVLTELVAAWCICAKHVMRARRCLRLLAANLERLQQELACTGCEGWTPMSHPEFLGFELDNDVCIRFVQSQVAKEILKNSHGNRLLQLNMGEGKTAVIMPLVLCAAANGDNIVRATVLSSLMSTNAADWQHKLGGLLGRRIYSLPCRRNIPFGPVQIKRLQQTIEKVKKGRHILVTVPEHRLSLENKALELSSSRSVHNDPEVGCALLGLVSHLSEKSRDFLDESDEILSPKYQVVYTLGPQCDMDGARLRWYVHAAVFQSVLLNGPLLLQRCGPETVELGDIRATRGERKLLRLLNSQTLNHTYRYLCRLIVADILERKVPTDRVLPLQMNFEEQSLWIKCVHGKAVSDEELAELSNSLRLSALILRGLLSHDVLLAMLTKRFRVDFGSHPTRSGYQMAVPYRAKDKAAEQTEFGQPDVALGLTFATYYQSGLSRMQLEQALQKLLQLSNSAAKSNYMDWANAASDGVILPEFDGVNLQDPVLFEKTLLPAFRHNIACIDFWLFTVVLPVQAKQFPYKLVATAGDLCRNNEQIPMWTTVTTGFSGTDDLKLTLPPTITQKNLTELERTNGVQLRSVIKPLNNKYHRLVGGGLNFTDQILQLLSDKERECDVLLDAGALILEKNNVDFARDWLAIRPDKQACAFFLGDSIYISTSAGEVEPFSLPYTEDMSKCLLYLDDEHTRGSDFLLPRQARALLTLGKGMTKDKLVQACMRMRQLRSSQSIGFAAAPEVDQQLQHDYFRNCSSDVYVPKGIVEWTISNTVKQICDLIPYSAGQAVLTARKCESFKKHYFLLDQDERSKEAAVATADACVEKDILFLRDLYGQQHQLMTLPLVVERHLQGLPESSNTAVAERFRTRVIEVAPSVSRYYSLLDEEQERELEQELEEERQVERPPPAVPQKPQVSPFLRSWLQKGRFEGFVGIAETFRESSLFPAIREQVAADLDLYCTEDFCRTVQGSGEKDDFIKRIKWIVVANTSIRTSLVVISNYEAEHFAHLVGGRSLSQRVYSFVALLRRGQPHDPLHGISTTLLSPALHVLGGSLYPDDTLREEMRKFLAIVPRPSQPEALEAWNNHFQDGNIDRDGFVHVEHRRIVDPDLCSSPVLTNPMETLVRLYSNVQHLGEDLYQSPIGRLIGVCELD